MAPASGSSTPGGPAGPMASASGSACGTRAPSSRRSTRVRSRRRAASGTRCSGSTSSRNARACRKKCSSRASRGPTRGHTIRLRGCWPVYSSRTSRRTSPSSGPTSRRRRRRESAPKRKARSIPTPVGMNGSAERSVDLTRTGFQVLALGGLVVVSFWIVQPFLMATAWGTMLAVATWPLLLRVEAWVGRRRSIAVIVMTTALLLVLIVPVYFGVTAIVDNTTQIAAWSNVVARRGLPPPPVWVSEIPLVGTRVMARWREAAAVTPEELASRLAPVATTAVLWFVGQVGNLTLLLVQLVLTLFVVVVAYANGETFGDAMERFARRVAGGHGDEAVHLAARAVRAVALGVIVTALAQAALVGLGFAVAGVPFAAILTALAFILSIAQIGPGLVLIGATVWVYVRSGVVWGTVFLVWAI